MRKDPTRPLWRARNERECQQMIDWVSAKLDEPPLLSPEDAARRVEEVRKDIREGGPQARAAHEGHVGPARELIRKHFPPLAAFVQLLPLKRGQKYRRKKSFGGARAYRRRRVENAAADVDRIREIWKAHYGKRNRRATDGPSAPEIAAERHGVTADEVEQYLKTFLRMKSRIS